MDSPHEAWQAARLIPTSGINGSDEQERRATSALLAVMTSVSEFGRRLVGPFGATGGAIETYIEVPFLLGEKKVIPDGLIRTSWGKKSWTALVEVKTGDNDLRAEQLENYLDVARQNGFDAVVTISNQIPPQPGVHPTAVSRQKLAKVSLYHLSWSEVLTEAVLLRQFKGLSDPDQAWILGELIRYLEHPRSGALSFHDMGANWVPIRTAVRTGTLRRSDKGIDDVVTHFDALVSFACLMLGRRLGVQVIVDLPRAQVRDPKLRRDTQVTQLVDEGALSASIRVPNIVAPIYVRANLKSGQVLCSLEVAAPTTGKPQTRVNWLTRQLKEAPPDVRIESFVSHAREGSAELLGSVRDDASRLVSDPKKEIVRFRVAQLHTAGTARGLGRNSFIESVLNAVDSFYEAVAEKLKAFVPPSPKLRESDATEPTPRDVASSTAESSSGHLSDASVADDVT